MEKNLTPKIRFRGFTEPWKERHFCDLAYRISETSSDVSLPHVEYENIFSGEGRIIDNDALYGDNRTGIKFQIGDVLFGKLRPYLHNDLVAPFNGVAVGDFWVLRSNECTSEFLYSLMSSKHFQRIANISSGSKMPRSDWSLVSFEKFASPIIDEQRKIGIILTSISKAIDSKREELEKLENVKRACMERMFPREGETTPQLRFKGFNDEWKEFKFEDICKITMGQSPDGSTYSDTPSDYILVQGNADLINKRVFPRVWTTQVTKTADAGDIIISVRAPVGSVGRTDFNVVIGRGVASIKGNNYIYYYLDKLDAFGYWNRLSKGSTFDSINSEDLYSLKLSIPSPSEQEKIGEYFHHLDELITAKRQEIEKLQDIKQSLLDKMFV